MSDRLDIMQEMSDAADDPQPYTDAELNYAASMRVTTQERHIMLARSLQLDAMRLGLDVLDASKRKEYPIGTGVIDYFPDAIAEIAHVSYIGNEQHNPGAKLHWDRSKSKDEADALMRHFLCRGKLDKDGIRHSAKMAWRALALLQKELEGENQ